jgi:tRNA (guanine37-N1)-methyltransferase
MTFHATILTLFPELYPSTLGHSLAGKALAQGLWSYNTVNIRDFATDKHKTVDDTTYGGGTGLVLKPDVVGAALESVDLRNYPCYYPSPRGRPLTQELVVTLAKSKGLTLLCGRYEGVDQRVLDAFGIQEVSLGDYILSNGDIASLVLLDAIIRCLPDVIGNDAVHARESFHQQLLEYPQYTKPAVWQGMTVPEVLLSGDHAKIAAWRQEQAEALTKARRPDLWQRRGTTT